MEGLQLQIRLLWAAVLCAEHKKNVLYAGLLNNACSLHRRVGIIQVQDAQTGGHETV